ncbi:MAG TPA: type VI secretion system contractile sheath large subunit [Methylomirabilota bacterium]|nr:type VI secretion system contractile sheath large subunit [Methylomirabilota bacterium]
MPPRLTIGSIALGTGKSPSTFARQDDGSPFRILLMADFSAAPMPRHAITKPVRVDLDNFDDVFARFSAKLELQIGTETFVLEPRSLADLHPDGLFQLDCFERLRDLRARLANPKSFATALPELHTLTGESPKPTETAAPSPAPPGEAEDQMFERLLGRPKSSPASAPAVPAVQALLREAVAGNVAAANATDQQSAIAALDSVIAARMSALLHAPAFQALEAAWRGLDFLVHRLELDDSLQLFALDVSAAHLREPSISRAISEALTLRDESGWSILVGDFSFANSADDAKALEWIASVAQKHNALFVAAADTALIDLINRRELHWPEEWDALRRSPSAQSVSLLTPQFMLRLPYGAKNEPIESFDFEEMPSSPAVTHYLWGNPALLAACALGNAFTESGETNPTGPLEVGGLPLHVYREDGESKMTACAERWLNDGELDALLANGISAVVTLRGSDAVRLLLHSIITSRK